MPVEPRSQPWKCFFGRAHAQQLFRHVTGSWRHAWQASLCLHDGRRARLVSEREPGRWSLRRRYVELAYTIPAGIRLASSRVRKGEVTTCHPSVAVCVILHMSPLYFSC